MAPEALKRTLQELTNERNITLSALLHLIITSPYVQTQQRTSIISIANQ